MSGVSARTSRTTYRPCISAASVFSEAKARGFDLKLLDIGGGFPAHYDETVPAFQKLAEAINPELDRLFPPPVEILAEPGRFLVASSATAVVKIIGKAIRGGKLCYYVDDGVYHTFSGVIFDHCQYPLKSFAKGPTQICSVFGPTCDALDTISLAEQLPDLELGDLALCAEHGRLLGGQQHALQWIPAGQSGAHERVSPQERRRRDRSELSRVAPHSTFMLRGLSGRLPMIRRRCDAIKGFDICR